MFLPARTRPDAACGRMYHGTATVRVRLPRERAPKAPSSAPAPVVIATSTIPGGRCTLASRPLSACPSRMKLPNSSPPAAPRTAPSLT